MNKIPNNYLEKVYAGFLGKCIGVKLGIPLEPGIWTHDKIRQVYGDMTGYIKSYSKLFVDDDINGPVFFIRALEDYGENRNLTGENLGNSWLNYACEGHGTIWWGGYGISTEQTAYLNMKNGIKAPMSGSIKRNGLIRAEQIGGQIFVDTWGLVFPGNVGKAAEYGGMEGSISHDGNGMYGGRFVAASIAKAFVTENIMEIIEAGLSVVPKDSDFMKVDRAVIDFYKNNPDDFRSCFKMIEENYGYDKYPGICHMVPNAGVVVLSLLYGKGCLSKTIEIATMCGWDTDCNAGTVGTIVGVAKGLKGIKDNYRKPLNDLVLSSSIAGSLNIIDVPTFCKELAIYGYRLAGEKIPKNLEYLTETRGKKNLHLDFELQGSTHGLKLFSDHESVKMQNCDNKSFSGKRSLQVSFNNYKNNDNGKLTFKTYFRMKEFVNNKYEPQFSPSVYPGQTLTVNCLPIFNEEYLSLRFYALGTHTKKEFNSESYNLKDAKWQDLKWKLPNLHGEAIEEIGIRFETLENKKLIGNLYIDSIVINGKAKYAVDFSSEKEEFNCVTQMTYNRGKWNLEEEKLHVLTNTDAEAYTGNYYTEDVNIITEVQPHVGMSHNLAFRIKGIMMGYHVGFNGKNRVALIKNDHGHKVLLESDYEWNHGENYIFEVKAVKNHFVFKIDNEIIFDFEDDKNNFFDYGMYGFSLLKHGRCSFTYLDVEEI